jgi:uncharacterized Ntn-hydrolase superfamily protein
MKKPLLLIAVILLCSPLWATWSIVAVDPETGEVGSAGASYTPAVWPILGIAGGHGVLVAQAAGNEGMRVKAVDMLLEDVPPSEILEVITDLGDNPRLGSQQYGIVSLQGGSAGFTGTDCDAWKGHSGDDFVMVQGNTLVSDAVVSDTLAAYRAAKAEGLPFAERLVKALAAGSAVGGDKRAEDSAISAMTAYVAVASPDDGPGQASFGIIVPPLDAGGNPVTELERLYYEAAGNDARMFFPSVKALIILFIVIPSIIGVVLFFLMMSKVRRRKTQPAFAWSLSFLGALAVQQILQFVLQQAGWALPIYGFFAWVYPAIVAVILIVLFIVIGIFLRAAKRKSA